MRSYKIESYVPKQNFYQGKDARFWSAAFEDCFVIDLHNDGRVIASCRGTKDETSPLLSATKLIPLSLGATKLIPHSRTAATNLIGLEKETNAPSLLSVDGGTLLVYPVWQSLGLALAFLFKEDVKTVEKSYQNAQRYAFSPIFEAENTPKAKLETKLCTLQFYIDRLFGDKRETNAAAHVLMIANLVGCRLHEMSVSRIDATLDEREIERLDAYLFCTFMTMRRYNGKISALTDDDGDKIDRAPNRATQEYGLRIQQSVAQRFTQATAFDLPSQTDLASFLSHPAFAGYRITEEDETVRLHIPLKQKALLSSISARGAQKEMTVILFPVFSFITTNVSGDPQ